MRLVRCAIPLSAALLALAGAATTATAAQDAAAPAPAPRYQNKYEVRFLDVHAAEALAWEQCPDKARCEVRAESYGGDSEARGVLFVSADGATHERIVGALTREDSQPPTQSFRVSFLAGLAKGDGAAAELAPDAQKALADLKGFLPYRSYRLLDSAWLRTTRRASASLAGAGGHEYQIDLAFRAFGTRKERSLMVERFHLVELTAEPGPGKPPRTRRQLIETSFGLKIGETIVVGTSKIDGTDDALIVLVTAVPPAP